MDVLAMIAAMTRAGAPDLIMLLLQASHSLQSELNASLAHVGISPRAYCVLSKALTAEHTQIQLAEACVLDKTTMVTTLDELEKAGLARRIPSTADRRARIVKVTPAGRRVVVKAEQIVSGLYRDVLGGLPPRECEGFVGALERLVGGRLSVSVKSENGPRRARAPNAAKSS